MQQAEEAAAEAEAERLRHLRLVLQRGVVQLQLLERLAQGVVLVRLDRVESGEDLGFDLLEAGKRPVRRALRQGDRVADLGGGQFLDAGDDEAHLARRQRVARLGLGREHADLLAQVRGTAGHELDPVLRLERPVLDPHQHDHADVVV